VPFLVSFSQKKSEKREWLISLVERSLTNIHGNQEEFVVLKMVITFFVVCIPHEDFADHVLVTLVVPIIRVKFALIEMPPGEHQ
jgi:uncharacterized membrane protein